MGRITFTLDTDMFSSGADNFEQLIRDIQAFINILSHASPDYYEAGLQLQRQLDEQVKEHDASTKEIDPVEQMKKKFCEIFDAANVGKGQFSAWDVDEHHGDEPVPGYWDAWDEFLSSIGGAPMLVAYAGVKLRRKFEAANQYYGWIDECIDYYEENWKF